MSQSENTFIINYNFYKNIKIDIDPLIRNLTLPTFFIIKRDVQFNDAHLSNLLMLILCPDQIKLKKSHYDL